MIVDGFVCMCISDSVVHKCVPVNDRVIGKLIAHSSVLCYERFTRCL